MNVIPFSFKEKQVRVVDVSGDAWFVAADVAAVLGYSNPRDAVSKHCKGVAKYDIPTSGGYQHVSILNESDVFRLIMRSNMPSADAFQDWVFEDVLPSIRKNGGYIAGQENDDPELIMAKALQVAQSVIERKSLELKKANETIALQAPKVEFVDKYVERSSLQTATQVAATFGISAVKMNKLLDEIGGVYDKRIKRSRAFCSEWIAKGYGETKQNDQGFSSSLFTPAGIMRVTEIFTSEGVI